MDVEDDDAFLYGDQSPPPKAQDVKPVVQGAGAGDAASKLSASMAASLAAYGIDPTEAHAAPENTEDGGVEEDDDLEEDSEDDEEDVKMVFGNQASNLDLRRPQGGPGSNVVGIGKWAHGSTGQAAAPVTLSMPAPKAQSASGPTANQTTEYTPAPRPGATPTTTTHNIQPPLAQLPLPSGAVPDPSVVQTSATSLPLSDLPPVTAPASHPKVELHPSGIVPSTGTSVYELDQAQFEGSGQPWRKPGSNLSDWFNFGFDEVSFPRYLRYRQEMEAGRIAMMNLPMGQMPPDVANLLHLPMMNQMNGMNDMNGMNVQMGFNPQQMQAMQQAMGMPGMPNMGNMGMDQGMMMAMQNMQGMPGMQNMQGMGNMQGMQGMGNGMGGMQRPQGAQRPSATPGPHGEIGDDVKQEEGSEPGQMSEPTVPDPNFRGRGVGRAIPGRGVARGRGAAPSGPRGGGLPANIPTGPKVPTGPKAGRFKDKDRVEASSGTLDYGDEPGAGDGSRSGSLQSMSPIKPRRRVDDDGYSSRSRSRSRSPRRSGRNTRSPRSPSSDSGRSASPKRASRGTRTRRSEDKERERDSRSKRNDEDSARKRDKRKREDGSGGAAVLGPGGWEEEEGGEKRSRRRRSVSEPDEAPRRSRRR